VPRRITTRGLTADKQTFIKFSQFLLIKYLRLSSSKCCLSKKNIFYTISAYTKIETLKKMFTKEDILELDKSQSKKGKRFFIALIAYLTLIVFFNVLSSYKSPTVRYHNQLISTDLYNFKNLLKTETDLLNEYLINDTSDRLENQIREELISFYQSRNYYPAWIDNYSTNQNFTTLINLMDSAAYFGFPTDYFNMASIHELREELNYTATNSNVQLNRLELELTTTYSALKFLLYLKHGIIERDTSSYLNSIHTLSEILNSAINHSAFRNEILGYQPDFVHHRNLLKSLSYFIDLHHSVKYTTPAFIDDQLLAKSLYYAEITEIPYFDSTNLKKHALFHLQDEYGLRHDSILNVPTHEVLVSLLQYKYHLACLNINRLRKLKYSGENYLFVNIPEFKLHVVDSNKEKETFNVIVGKKRTPTPVLSSNIEKVVTNPFWTVPRSITFEMLHKIRKDSTYLERNGFFVINGQEKIVDPSIIDWHSDDPLSKKYWLRQINSKYNALGQIKFIFPNNYSVYLHDTQSKDLFKQENRTFSHGCIRLENPDQLAQYLTDKFSEGKNKNIKNLILTNKRNEINFSEKINIHIQYITCYATENSEIVFYNDIYKLDNEEIKATFPDIL